MRKMIVVSSLSLSVGFSGGMLMFADLNPAAKVLFVLALAIGSVGIGRVVAEPIRY